MDNEFWSFSLRTYAAQGVAECALEVQDQMGLDVNVILYASWLAACDRRLTGSHLAALENCVSPWREQVVKPLPALRRQLRDYLEASDLRESIKSLELKAEQQQQDKMWEFFQSSASLDAGKCALDENLGLLVDSDEAQSEVWQHLVTRIGRAIAT